MQSIDGIINLDKPAGISSALAVTRIKHMLPKGVKIGHAGTLDPFATGVLVLLIGRRATRLAERFMFEPKQYAATVKLGVTTPTLDPTSQEIIAPGIAVPSREQVDLALKSFIGLIDQVPPAFSALKIAGRPAYRMARKGQEVDLAPRKVRVYAIELRRYEWPNLELRIDCGRGTYIRSLARDIAAKLGTSGYLTALRRTRVGPCRIEDASTLEQAASAPIDESIMPIGRISFTVDAPPPA